LEPARSPHTRAFIHLDRLAHNMRVLQARAGKRPLWPAIKANAYGHGADIVARKLVALGYDRLCVAHVGEARALRDAGVTASFVVLSPGLPKDAGDYVDCGVEAAVCTPEMVEALGAAALRARTRAPIHVIVDTGMGRVGIRPDEVADFVAGARAVEGIRIAGVMSHFPRADERDLSYSRAQTERFNAVRARLSDLQAPHHLANSAGILALPESLFDAARPGIAIYGLNPFRPDVQNTDAQELRPVLELRTRVTFLKEVESGTGLSYGHSWHASRPSLIATVPIGYGDGLSRSLSNRMEMLVQGIRCPQVGTITMDQCLLDVSALRGGIRVGEEVVVIGRQGAEELRADDLARTLGTINYEIVTSIAASVPRLEAPQKGDGGNIF
jgi:alanine racemase